MKPGGTHPVLVSREKIQKSNIKKKQEKVIGFEESLLLHACK